MLRNKKGFGSITMYLGIALLVVSVTMGAIVYGQHQKIMRLKAENVRLTTDNGMITKNAVTQHKADVAYIKTVEEQRDECLAQQGQCEMFIITECPTIEMGKENDPVAKEWNLIWEVR